MLAVLAKMHGTPLEQEVAKFNEYAAERIAHNQKRWSKTEEERAARATASKKRQDDKAKAARAGRGFEACTER